MATGVVVAPSSVPMGGYIRMAVVGPSESVPECSVDIGHTWEEYCDTTPSSPLSKPSLEGGGGAWQGSRVVLGRAGTEKRLQYI